jgi:hypothetical protein
MSDSTLRVFFVALAGLDGKEKHRLLLPLTNLEKILPTDRKTD